MVGQLIERPVDQPVVIVDTGFHPERAQPFRAVPVARKDPVHVGAGDPAVDGLGAVRPAVRESAMLVRGEDRHGHFDPEPRPASDMDAAALKAHEAAMAKMGTYQNEQKLSKGSR